MGYSTQEFMKFDDISHFMKIETTIANVTSAMT
jgi:hypothetical protein